MPDTPCLRRILTTAALPFRVSSPLTKRSFMLLSFRRLAACLKTRRATTAWTPSLTTLEPFIPAFIMSSRWEICIICPSDSPSARQALVSAIFSANIPLPSIFHPRPFMLFPLITSLTHCLVPRLLKMASARAMFQTELLMFFPVLSSALVLYIWTSCGVLLPVVCAPMSILRT